MKSLCLKCPAKDKCLYMTERKTVCNKYEGELVIKICEGIYNGK